MRTFKQAYLLLQGIEPEGFPLLIQSLKTDGPIKDIHSNPNKKLYGGKDRLLTLRASLASFLCGGADAWVVLPALRSHGALAGRQHLPVDKETRRSSRLCQVLLPRTDFTLLYNGFSFTQSQANQWLLYINMEILQK